VLFRSSQALSVWPVSTQRRRAAGTGSEVAVTAWRLAQHRGSSEPALRFLVVVEHLVRLDEELRHRGVLAVPVALAALELDGGLPLLDLLRGPGGRPARPPPAAGGGRGSRSDRPETAVAAAHPSRRLRRRLLGVLRGRLGAGRRFRRARRHRHPTRRRHRPSNRPLRPCRLRLPRTNRLLRRHRTTNRWPRRPTRRGRPSRRTTRPRLSRRPRRHRRTGAGGRPPVCVRAGPPPGPAPSACPGRSRSWALGGGSGARGGTGTPPGGDTGPATGPSAPAGSDCPERTGCSGGTGPLTGGPDG